jgi:hypothetical protein
MCRVDSQIFKWRIHFSIQILVLADVFYLTLDHIMAIFGKSVIKRMQKSKRDFNWSWDINRALLFSPALR